MMLKIDRVFKICTLLGLALLMVGCTNALNWRKATVNNERVQLLMPCKPDQASREMQIGPDVRVSLTLKGCEASGMHFTMAHMQVPQGMASTDVLKKWQKASLASMQAGPQDVVAMNWPLKGAQQAALPERVRVQNGQHRVQMVWFVLADQIYQAAVYGHSKEKQLPDAAETYFTGIELL
jgi:hypothetical protein